MERDYKREYEHLVDFLIELIKEAEDNERYNDDIDNIVNHLANLGEI